MNINGINYEVGDRIRFTEDVQGFFRVGQEWEIINLFSGMESAPAWFELQNHSVFNDNHTYVFPRYQQAPPFEKVESDQNSLINRQVWVEDDDPRDSALGRVIEIRDDDDIASCLIRYEGNNVESIDESEAWVPRSELYILIDKDPEAGDLVVILDNSNGRRGQVAQVESVDEDTHANLGAYLSIDDNEIGLHSTNEFKIIDHNFDDGEPEQPNSLIGKQIYSPNYGICTIVNIARGEDGTSYQTTSGDLFPPHTFYVLIDKTPEVGDEIVFTRSFYEDNIEEGERGAITRVNGQMAFVTFMNPSIQATYFHPSNFRIIDPQYIDYYQSEDAPDLEPEEDRLSSYFSVGDTVYVINNDSNDYGFEEGTSGEVVRVRDGVYYGINVRIGSEDYLFSGGELSHNDPNHINPSLREPREEDYFDEPNVPVETKPYKFKEGDVVKVKPINPNNGKMGKIVRPSVVFGHRQYYLVYFDPIRGSYDIPENELQLYTPPKTVMTSDDLEELPDDPTDQDVRFKKLELDESKKKTNKFIYIAVINGKAANKPFNNPFDAEEWIKAVYPESTPEIWKLTEDWKTEKQVDIEEPVAKKKEKIDENKQLLNEVKYEEAVKIVEKQINKRIEYPEQFQEYGLRIMQRLPQDITDNQKATALLWIARIVLNSDFETFHGYNHERWRQDSKGIELFFQNQRFMRERDLNRISSFKELEQIVDEAKPKIDAHRAKKSKGEGLAGSQLIGEIDTHYVYIPRNKDAACYLGVGTDWCTSNSEINSFDHYSKDDDPLFILMPKDNQHFKDRFQIHFGTSQFKDVYDNEVPSATAIRFYKKLSAVPIIRDFYKIVGEMIQFKNLNKGDADAYGEPYPFDTELNMTNHQLYRKYRDETGVVEEVSLDGKLHNIDGPAKVTWDKNGTIIDKQYWLGGMKYASYDWEITKRTYAIKYLVNESKKLLNEVTYQDAGNIVRARLEKEVPKIIKKFNLENDLSRAFNRINNRIFDCVPRDISDNQQATSILWVSRIMLSDESMLRMVVFSSYQDQELSTIIHLGINKPLELFFQNQRFMRVRDLNRIQSFDELRQITKEAKAAISAHQLKKAKDPSQGSELIGSIEGYDIYIPRNKAAACALGAGTDWCTANPEYNAFDTYYRDNDPLFILMPKDGDQNKRIQIHFGSDQCKDYRDNELPMKERIRLFVQLKSVPIIGEFIHIKDGLIRFEGNCEEEDNGLKIIKYYDINRGVFHNPEGPAYVNQCESRVTYYHYGEIHNLNGPAVIEAGDPNYGEYHEYWIRGVQYSKIDWERERVHYDYLMENKVKELFINQWRQING